MANKIDKLNFYSFLERMLNSVYDKEDFKLNINSKDLNSDVIGTEFEYSIVNSDNNKMFETNSSRVYIERTFSGYQSRNYNINDTLNISGDEIRNLLAPYVYKYKVLEIVPLLIETYLEEEENQNEVLKLNEDEINNLIIVAKDYHRSQARVKVRAINSFTK